MRCTSPASRRSQLPQIAERRGTPRSALRFENILICTFGITAVELLPIFQFDRQDCPPGLVNYWGYSPVSFVLGMPGIVRRRIRSDRSTSSVTLLRRCTAPASRRSWMSSITTPPKEVRKGPLSGFRGLANEIYYILDNDRAQYERQRHRKYAERKSVDRAPHDPRQRAILGHPHARRWVPVRPRLDPVPGRGRQSTPKSPGSGISTWIPPSPASNRSPRRGTPPVSIRSRTSSATIGRSGTAGSATMSAALSKATAPSGYWRSAHLAALTFSDTRSGSRNRINFITCHDGFTLNDLVSYNDKHNEANEEGNRDGPSTNFSRNCGVEGPTGDAAVEQLRRRQVKNFFVILLTSIGAPMFRMGDEMRRTQRGNSNAYCQNNEVSWLDWSLLDRHRDLHQFVRKLIFQRLQLLGLGDEEKLRAEPQRAAAPRRDRLARRPARAAGLG